MAILSKEDQKQLMAKAGIAEPIDVSISFDEINKFGDKESFIENVKNISNYERILKQRITLINKSLTAAIPFTKESLYLFCAVSGSGKSTIAANISFPLWKQDKTILVISNEETSQDILMRIAALDLGYDFNKYKKGEMSEEHRRECITLFPSIMRSVKVIDVTAKNGLTTKLEGVQNALESVKGSGYHAVLIDYFQLIKDSIKDKSRTRYDVLNDFRIWLGRYIKSCDIPVVLFAQLHSMSKKGGAKDIDARIKECPAVVEPATVIIEAIPNFEEHTTDFLIHKDRFGVAGKRFTCPFENGRFLEQLSEDELEKRKLMFSRKQAEKDLDDLVELTKDKEDKQFSGSDYIAGQKI